jgi:hypothetical protein
MADADSSSGGKRQMTVAIAVQRVLSRSEERWEKASRMRSAH